MDPVREAELATGLAAFGDLELDCWAEAAAIEEASFEQLPATTVAAVAVSSHDRIRAMARDRNRS